MSDDATDRTGETDAEPPAGSDSTAVGDRLPTTVRQFEGGRTRWALWIAALALTAALAYVAWRFVGTVVVGVFAYYVTRPVLERIDERVASRTVAVGVALVTVAFPVLVLAGWTLSVAAAALTDVVSGDLGTQIAAALEPYADLTPVAADITTAFRGVLDDPARLADLELGPVLGETIEGFSGIVGDLFAVGLHAFVALVVAFYLLRDDSRLADWARRTFAAPGGVIERYLVAVDRDLKNVFFGNILNALLTGFLAVGTYLLLDAVAPGPVRIPEPALVGLLVGAASLVPVIGIKLVTWPVGLYLLARAGLLAPEAVWFPVTFLVVSFVVVDYVPDQLLRPYVSGRTLHIGAVMLAYTLGPLLFGWYGIFLGPLIFVVMFDFGRIVVPWLADPETAGDCSERAATELPSSDPASEGDDAPSGPNSPPASE
ncbi:AI-2E family transporter [Halosimplex marinum]|uniref:AI-2E family transporter n=1 Tax=Halosimplex marinum TaxID=3396620 RepID=UPI003F5647D4